VRKKRMGSETDQRCSRSYCVSVLCYIKIISEMQSNQMDCQRSSSHPVDQGKSCWGRLMRPTVDLGKSN